MGILERKNCVRNSNKIPEYAREFKNEYLLLNKLLAISINFLSEEFLTESS